MVVSSQGSITSVASTHIGKRLSCNRSTTISSCRYVLSKGLRSGQEKVPFNARADFHL